MLGIFSGFWIYCSTREHLLSVLLRLEFIAIRIFFVFLLGIFEGTYFYSLIFLVITACEGALGLSILVIISRTHGGDYFKSFNFLV